MLPNVEKYGIREIARELKKKSGINDHLFLSLLQEGHISAFIYFPTYFENVTYIPKEYWAELDTSDIYFSDKPPTKKYQYECFIKPDWFFDREHERLDKLLSAAADGDVEVLNNDEKLYNIVHNRVYYIENGKAPPWPDIVRLYGKLLNELHDEVDQDFEIFISREEWLNVKKEFVVDPNEIKNADSRGRPQSERWPEVYEALLDSITEKIEKKPLHEWLGYKTKDSFYHDLLDRAKRRRSEQDTPPQSPLPGISSIKKCFQPRLKDKK